MLKKNLTLSLVLMQFVPLSAHAHTLVAALRRERIFIDTVGAGSRIRLKHTGPTVFLLYGVEAGFGRGVRRTYRAKERLRLRSVYRSNCLSGGYPKGIELVCSERSPCAWKLTAFRLRCIGIEGECTPNFWSPPHRHSSGFNADWFCCGAGAVLSVRS